MQTLPREQASDTWTKWWNDLLEEWFKVEMLQDYTPEDNGTSLQLWLQGDRAGSIALMAEEMKEFIDECKQNPAKKVRIHIVEKPYTPYLEWEIALYKQVHIPIIGEHIFIIPKEHVSHLLLPEGDFMIFDRKRAIQNHYNSEGFMESMDFYNESENIDSFLELRKELLAIATEFQI